MILHVSVYSDEGLDLSAYSPSELKNSYDVVMLIDLDKDLFVYDGIIAEFLEVKLLSFIIGFISTRVYKPSQMFQTKKIRTLYNMELTHTYNRRFSPYSQF